MAFNVGDKIVYVNGFGRPAGVGVIADLNGTMAKIFYDANNPKSGVNKSFYTYSDVKNLEHYKEEKENV